MQQTGLNQRKEFIERTKALGLGICVIFIGVATGPFAIGLALLFQWWCASCRIDPRDRWDNVRVFAWLLGIPAGLFYLADIIFHSQVVHYWVRSPLHGLGSPTADNFVFLWVVGLVWSPALTFLIEEGRPQTIRRFLRVKTNDETQAEKQRLAREQAEKQAVQQRAAEAERRKKEKFVTDLQATTQRQVKIPASGSTSAPEPSKDQRTIEERRRDEWLKEQAAHRARQTPPEVQPRPTLERQATPPSPPPKKKEKPDWGDGDMSSLL